MPNIPRLAKYKRVGKLIKALAHQDISIRDQAKWALVKIGEPAIPKLITALQAKDSNVRYNAALVLGEISDPRAQEPLIKALNNYEDPTLRSCAAEALGKVGNISAIEPLLHTIYNRPNISSRCADSIWEICNRVPKSSYQEDLLPILNAFIPETDSRYGGYKSDDRHKTYMKEVAAEVLWRIGDKKGDQILFDALNKYRIMEAKAAAKALGKFGNSGAVQPLIEVLNNEKFPCSSIQKETIISLGIIGDPQAVEPLIAKLKSTITEERAAAAWALGNIGDQKAIQPLQQLLDDNAPVVVESAQDALKELQENQKIEPDALIIIFYDRVPLSDRKTFALDVIDSEFPELLGLKTIKIEFIVDRDMPTNASSADLNSYPSALMKSVFLLEKYGMKSDHVDAWCDFSDLYGARGMVYVFK
jgi:HEAT repeat protein